MKVNQIFRGKKSRKNQSEAGREPRDDGALNYGKREFQEEGGAQ